VLIKLLEKYPIIAVDEARMLGHLKGAALQDNRLVAILASLENEAGTYAHLCRKDINKNIEIPIEHLTVGHDAFIIQKSSVAKICSPHEQIIQSEIGVYTCEGEFLGGITGVEIDKDHVLQGIYIESHYIESEHVIKIGDVIIVDSDTVKREFDAIPENSTVFLKVIQEEEDDDKELQASNEEPNDIEEELIYSRYRYLLGKKLINPVTIADKTYPNESIINTELIRAAINNNCILSVIMNAED